MIKDNAQLLESLMAEHAELTDKITALDDFIFVAKAERVARAKKSISIESADLLTDQYLAMKKYQSTLASRIGLATIENRTDHKEAIVKCGFCPRTATREHADKNWRENGGSSYMCPTCDKCRDEQMEEQS